MRLTPVHLNVTYIYHTYITYSTRVVSIDTMVYAYVVHTNCGILVTVMSNEISVICVASSFLWGAVGRSLETKTEITDQPRVLKQKRRSRPCVGRRSHFCFTFPGSVIQAKKISRGFEVRITAVHVQWACKKSGTAPVVP